MTMIVSNIKQTIIFDSVTTQSTTPGNITHPIRQAQNKSKYVSKNANANNHDRNAQEAN